MKTRRAHTAWEAFELWWLYKPGVICTLSVLVSGKFQTELCERDASYMPQSDGIKL